MTKQEYNQIRGEYRKQLRKAWNDFDVFFCRFGMAHPLTMAAYKHFDDIWQDWIACMVWPSARVALDALTTREWWTTDGRAGVRL